MLHPLSATECKSDFEEEALKITRTKLSFLWIYGASIALANLILMGLHGGKINSNIDLTRSE